MINAGISEILGRLGKSKSVVPTRALVQDMLIPKVSFYRRFHSDELPILLHNRTTKTTTRLHNYNLHMY